MPNRLYKLGPKGEEYIVSDVLLKQIEALNPGQPVTDEAIRKAYSTNPGMFEAHKRRSGNYADAEAKTVGFKAEANPAPVNIPTTNIPVAPASQVFSSPEEAMKALNDEVRDIPNPPADKKTGKGKKLGGGGEEEKTYSTFLPKEEPISMSALTDEFELNNQRLTEAEKNKQLQAEKKITSSAEKRGEQEAKRYEDEQKKALANEPKAEDAQKKMLNKYLADTEPKKDPALKSNKEPKSMSAVSEELESENQKKQKAAEDKLTAAELKRAETAGKRGELEAKRLADEQAKNERTADKVQQQMLGKALDESGIKGRSTGYTDATQEDAARKFYYGAIEGYPDREKALSKADPRFVNPSITRYTSQNLPDGTSKITASFTNDQGKTQSVSILLDKMGKVFDKAAKQIEDATSKKENKNQESGRALNFSGQHSTQQEAAKLRGQGFEQATIENERIDASKKFYEENIRPNANLQRALANADPRFLNPTQTKYSQQGLPGGASKVTASFTNDQGKTQTETVTLDKMGNAVETVSRKFKNFGQQLATNFGEIAKWSLAVSILYGPMQKLNEVMTAMIANQTRLAQVAVTLGSGQEVTNKIFSASVDIARETGVAVEGIIEGYNTALRATGDVANSTERYAKANELLKSSIILAKISGMDQAQATDTLTAAYKQVGDSIGSSGELLDKWVTVSRNANVDVATLATSFAVVAESAQGAGLSVDELNGMIATMAEKSITGARETGNAVRQLIAGYSTDGAVKELSKFGIAVTDVEGKTRGIKEVFADIKGAVDNGLISTDELNKIAYTVGGGSRGQARSVIEMLGFDRSMQVAEVSKQAPKGAAEEAMGKLLDTIEGSIAQLNISFTELAQTLGTSGGLLDALQGLINLSNVGVKGLNELTKSLGGGVMFLTAVGMSSALFKKGDMGNLGYSAFAKPFGAIKDAINQPSPDGIVQSAINFKDTTFKKIGEIAGADFGKYAKNASAGIGMTIAGGFLALMRASSGDTGGAAISFGATIVGGMVGAAFGVAPLGAMIGTIAGESMATAIENNRNRIKSALANAAAPTEAPQPTVDKANAPAGTIDSTGNVIDKMLLAATYGNGFETKSANAGSAFGRDVNTENVNTVQQFAVDLMDEYKTKTNKELNYNDALKMINQTKVEQGKDTTFTWGDFSKTYKNGYLPPAVQTVLSRREEPVPEKTLQSLFVENSIKALDLKQTTYQKAQTDFGNENKDYINSLKQQQLDMLQGQFDQRLISQKELIDKKLDVKSGTNRVANLAFPLGDQAGKDMIPKIMSIISKGTPDELASLTSYQATLQKQQEDLAKAQTKPEYATNKTTGVTEMQIDTGNGMVGETEFKQKMVDTNQAYLELLAETYDNVINRTIIPSIMDFTKKSFTTAQFTTAVTAEGLRGYQEKLASQLSKIDPKYGKAFMNQETEGVGVMVKTQGGDITKYQATQDTLNSYIEEQKNAGKLQDASQLGLEKTPLKLSELQDPNSEFNQTYERILKETTAMGYQPTLENTLLYTEDKQLFNFNQKDARIKQLALDAINDKLQKQLNGVYNLPSGASFYVPYQAAKMSRETDTRLNSGTSNSVFSSAVDKFKDAVTQMITGKSGSQERIQPQDWEQYAKLAKGTNPTLSSTTSNTANPAQSYGSIQVDPEMLKYYNDKNRNEKKYINEDNLNPYNSGKRAQNETEDYTLPWHYLGARGGMGASGGSLMSASSYPTQADNESTNKSISAKLELNIDNRVTLIANGRVLAEVIKPYLESDMVNFSNSTTSRVSRSSGYAIGV